MATHVNICVIMVVVHIAMGTTGCSVWPCTKKVVIPLSVDLREVDLFPGSEMGDSCHYILDVLQPISLNMNKSLAAICNSRFFFNNESCNTLTLTPHWPTYPNCFCDLLVLNYVKLANIAAVGKA